MMDAPEDEPTIGAYVRALARSRLVWPLPGLLLLLLCLPFASAAAWLPRTGVRRTLSLAELSIVLSVAGTVLYWLVLLLAHLGVLHMTRSLMMREASEAEKMLVEAATRWLCLLMAYAGPLLLLLAD